MECLRGRYLPHCRTCSLVLSHSSRAPLLCYWLSSASSRGHVGYGSGGDGDQRKRHRKRKGDRNGDAVAVIVVGYLALPLLLVAFASRISNRSTLTPTRTSERVNEREIDLQCWLTSALSLLYVLSTTKRNLIRLSAFDSALIRHHTRILSDR